MLDITPGSTLGGYEIIRELGRGGMGVVYKAHEQSLQRVVALKILPQHLVDDPVLIKRFKREARSAAQLNHPNIVHIYAIGEQDGTHFIAMEYVKGTSLMELIRKEGQLDVQQALKITGQIAQALGAAHAVGIVHRDIKPHNVMVDPAHRARVMDFGLASLESARTQLTEAGASLGTPSYMSPEQCQGEAVGPTSDIYSLGVTLYLMLAGRVPFKGDSPLAIMHQIVSNPPTPVTEYNSEVPPPVVAVLDKMMARDPKQRYQNAQDLADDLRRVFQERAPAAKSSTPKTQRAVSDSGASFTTPEVPDPTLQSAFVPLPAAPTRPNIPLKAVGIGAGAVVLVALFAVGIVGLFSRLGSPDDAPLPSARRIIEFPNDRVVGELRLRDIGDPWWGTPIGEARGPFLVPDGKEVGLSVNFNHAPDLSFLRDLAADDLSVLMINRPEIDDLQLQNLEHLTGLKTMHVAFCRITDNGLGSFSGLNQLEFLGLTGTSITDDGLAKLSGLEGLTGLGLGRTKVTHRGIRAVRRLRKIQLFSLSGAALTQPMVDALKEFPNLAFLNIDADFLSYPGFVVDPDLGLDPVVPTRPESILLLKDLSQLNGLSLRGKLNDDSLIPALSQLTFLKRIGLVSTSVTPEGRDRLRRALPNCTITP